MEVLFMKKVTNAVKQHTSHSLIKLYFLLFSMIGMYIRYMARDFISYDMQKFLIPWFQTIKSNGGVTALSQQVGDYGLLYQTIIAMLSYANVNPVYLYKVISVFFDFLIAGSVAFFISKVDSKNLCNNGIGNKIHIYYGCVLLLPTVVMNSAFWGQCDSIYTFFLLWSLWFLHKERYDLSFFMLGCSFAFKLQCIFLAPLFLFFYIYKRFSFIYFYITVCTFWLSGIIAYIYGRDITDGFGVYFYQIGEYKRMWMNAPNIWFFFEENYEKLHVLAIGLTFVILGIVLLLLLKSDFDITSFEQTITLALFIEWTCIIFLPSMHERYTYVMDILALLLAFVDKKFVKYTIVIVATSCITYIAYFLAERNMLSFFVPFYFLFIPLYILTWLHYTYSFCLKYFSE